MYRQTVRIRWRDVDAYGHVNNAVYLTSLEECRDRWVKEVIGGGFFEFVIVRIAIDYRRELGLEDEEVTVTCRGTGYGTSSIRTAEQIIAKEGWVAASSESVIVAHDPTARAARPLTDAERIRLDAAIGADAGADADLLSPGGPAGRT
ncbi:MAG: acyl-CoA thioesterase [Actinomycetota bacterium]